jgi:hypothetical protein
LLCDRALCCDLNLVTADGCGATSSDKPFVLWVSVCVCVCVCVCVFWFFCLALFCCFVMIHDVCMYVWMHTGGKRDGTLIRAQGVSLPG